VVGDGGDGALGGREADALGGHVGGHALHGGAQRAEFRFHVGVDDGQEAAHDQRGLVAGEGFVPTEGAVGEADDDAEVGDLFDGVARPVPAGMSGKLGPRRCHRRAGPPGS
jgi:hypothetical protein